MTYLIIRATERQKETQWEALDFLSLEGFKQRLNNHLLGILLYCVPSLSYKYKSNILL